MVFTVTPRQGMKYTGTKVVENPASITEAFAVLIRREIQVLISIWKK